MGIKRHIPNIITLGNLACGMLAIVTTFDHSISNAFGLAPAEMVGLLVMLALVFDFLDGGVARALKVSSEIGAQLDSLSDMVTFGVLPGILIFLTLSSGGEIAVQGPALVNEIASLWDLLPFTALLIPIFSAYRLAKFNLDTRSSNVFYGLPTPANALFFISLYLFKFLKTKLEMPADEMAGAFSFFSETTHEASPMFENGVYGLLHSGLVWLVQPLPLAIATVVFCILMVTDLPLLSFKFKSFAFRTNIARYLFIGISLILLIVLWYQAVPVIMAFYFLFSFIDHKFLKKDIP